MRNSVKDCASTVSTRSFSIFILNFFLVIVIFALAAPLMAQLPTERPHHVTPWTPMPPPAAPPAPQVPAEAVPLLSTSSWTFIGPGPLSTTTDWSNVSGRITGIAPHPSDSNTIYVAPAGGGVWKTIDGGTTWTPLTDTQATLSMGAIAVAPSNASVVYAGTGEANNAADSNFGRGILVSTNGGSTWTLTTGPSGIFNTRRLTTSQIAVDPTDSTIAYAAIADFGENGLYGSNTGIWKTTNSGTTWTNMTAAALLNSSDPWSAVVIDPSNHLNIYAALGRNDGIAANGVYKSTNGGTNWSLLSNGPNGSTVGRIAIALAPSNTQVLYVTASNPSTSGLGKIMRSDDGGSTFPADLTSGTPNYMGGQGWYDTTLIVDPSNSAIVYVAGAAGNNSILRSTNSGVNWTDIHTGGSPNFISPHVDHHGIAFDASGRLLDGDDGGIYRLDNPTTPAWTDLNGNLGTIQFQGIGLHPTDANKAIGGTQDNGTEIFTGTVTWTETDGGDGGFAKYSPTNGNRVYHQIPVLSFGTNFFRRSDSGGTSGTWVTKTSTISVDTTQNFYAPFVVDPGNGDRVLYGTTHVWETTNGGDGWSAISVIGSNGFNSSGHNVDALGIAASDANTIYAATGGEFASSSQIFVTTSHGSTWTEHDLPGGSARVNEIQVDRSNSQIAYAVVNQFGGGHVFRTANGGGTWTDISGNLPSEPVWSLQVDPGGTLYLGAEDGVYASTNGGTTWTRFGTGLPNAQVFQIELNTTLHILGAGTHGRGMWEILTTPIPVKSDFNGDGFTDYLLFNSVSRATAIWYLHGATLAGGAYGPTLPAGWVVGCVADVNLDGKPDYVLFNPSTRQTAVWFLNNATFLSGAYGPTLPAGWMLIAAVDFNADGKPDDVLFNPGTRQTAIWYLNGPAFASGAYGPTLPSGWTLEGAADFNANGNPDYVLFNPSTRQTAIWYLNGPAFASGAFGPTLPAGYSLVFP